MTHCRNQSVRPCPRGRRVTFTPCNPLTCNCIAFQLLKIISLVNSLKVKNEKAFDTLDQSDFEKVSEIETEVLMRKTNINSENKMYVRRLEIRNT